LTLKGLKILDDPFEGIILLSDIICYLLTFKQQMDIYYGNSLNSLSNE